MSSGRLFQSLGTETANDRSPTDASLDEGTKRSSEVDIVLSLVLSFLLFVCMQKCWWKLNGDDIASIASRVAVAGRQTTSTVTALGRWLNANVAAVNDSQLKLLLAAHGDFGIVLGRDSFIPPLEKYVSARVANMDRTAVAMCVDLLHRQRWLSTRILDAVASEYTASA